MDCSSGFIFKEETVCFGCVISLMAGEISVGIIVSSGVINGSFGVISDAVSSPIGIEGVSSIVFVIGVISSMGTIGSTSGIKVSVSGIISGVSLGAIGSNSPGGTISPASVISGIGDG